MDILQVIANEKFYFEKQNSCNVNNYEYPNTEWITLTWLNKSHKIKLMQINPVKYYLMDFYAQNLIRSTGDIAYSTHHVSMFTNDGFLDLTNNLFFKCNNTVKKQYSVSLTEYDTLLKKYFGIIK